MNENEEPVLKFTVDQWTGMFRQCVAIPLGEEAAEAYAAFAEFGLYEELIVTRASENWPASDAKKRPAFARWRRLHRRYLTSAVWDAAAQRWPADPRIRAYLERDTTWARIDPQEADAYLGFSAYLHEARLCVARGERVVESKAAEDAYYRWLDAHYRMVGAKVKEVLEGALGIRVEMTIDSARPRHSTSPTESS